VAGRPFADPDAAARNIVEIANEVEAVQNGRICIERVNAPFLLASWYASVTTVEQVNTYKVSNDAIPGTTGLAKPHPQLDRAPGEPILKDR
jgi:hypothetical protein